MSFALKRRIVIALLLTIAAWPGAHHALARRYHFDAWKFFGWAMYAAPVPYVEVTLAQRVDGGFRPLALTPDLRARVEDWADRRALWGERLPPDDLAEALHAAVPDAEGIAVGVRRYVLDRRTAMTRFEDRRYDYRVVGGRLERDPA